MKFRKHIGGKYQETVEFRFRDIEVIADTAYIKTKSGVMQCIDCDDETEHKVEVVQDVVPNMVTKKAEELAKEEYPSIIGTTSTGVGYNMNEREQQAFIKGCNSRQSEIDELTKACEYKDRLYKGLNGMFQEKENEILELTKERDILKKQNENLLKIGDKDFISIYELMCEKDELTKEVEILEEWNKKHEDNQVENFERVKNQEHKIVELTKEVERLRKERHILLLDFYKGLKNIGRLYSDNTSEEIMMNDVSEFLTTH